LARRLQPNCFEDFLVAARLSHALRARDPQVEAGFGENTIHEPTLISTNKGKCLLV
jgi:hypothetical protein